MLRKLPSVVTWGATRAGRLGARARSGGQRTVARLLRALAAPGAGLAGSVAALTAAARSSCSGNLRGARTLRVLAGLAAGLVVLLAGAEAWARIGGGDTYGGGSRGRGGGGGGGGGDGGELEAIFFLVRLCIYYPRVGIPLLLIVVGYFVLRARANSHRRDWSTPLPSGASVEPFAPPTRGGRKLLQGLQARDPDFSLVVFEDFLFALYATVHQARGAGKLDELSPYLAEPARLVLAGLAPGLQEVSGVVVGAMGIAEVHGVVPPADRVRVSVRFEANYAEKSGAGAGRTFYAVERWTLSRAATARSRPPARARKFGCPNCGAALDGIRGSNCSYCGRLVDRGDFDWRVERVQVLRREARPPEVLGSTEEQGTWLPTLIDPDAERLLGELKARDPAFDWGSFSGRATMIFEALQAAWSSRQWDQARPFVSDNLYETQGYWLDAFARRRIRNVLREVRVQDVLLAAVSRDAFFDAITVRIFATCLDYYENEQDGSLLGGSRSTPRHFSEYWTFIRGVGRTGAATQERKCPNCGAPLQINQTGQCEYCQARVTSGEFDWVLSRIEQDEAYEG